MDTRRVSRAYPMLPSAKDSIRQPTPEPSPAGDTTDPPNRSAIQECAALQAKGTLQIEGTDQRKAKGVNHGSRPDAPESSDAWENEEG